MSDPRFRPRHMAAPPDRRHFGKLSEIQWLTGTTELEISRVEAARLQHSFAVRINQRLRDQGHSIRAYATLTGSGYDRMTKVLRGEAVMRLEDVADAERLLGGIVQTPPTARQTS
ncbi:hypothetical protein ACQ3I4_15720 [Zafaria sp. Z1313]|uniref:hypothetical protein n=1 Tax=unclassified Zafaria TaxID=2828765 RepID=UPI002E77737B|nr:hypothetical protein [Zafaria sp. J156]MEE1622728.1 hypothetical protein [Zafaria sp. J156]